SETQEVTDKWVAGYAASQGQTSVATYFESQATYWAAHPSPPPKPAPPPPAAVRPSAPTRTAAAGSRLGPALAHGAPLLAAMLGGGDGEQPYPLEDATYSEKVILDMEMGDYHAFPSIVDKIAAETGQATVERGGDGKMYTHVRLEGGYENEDEGTFHYVIDGEGKIQHRMFEPSDTSDEQAMSAEARSEAMVEAQAEALAEAEALAMD